MPLHICKPFCSADGTVAVLHLYSSSAVIFEMGDGGSELVLLLRSYMLHDYVVV